jgi:hypothetical protein
MAMTMPEIQSLGLPPERHADRVVLEMLKVIAATRRKTWPRIHDILRRSPDGNPKAQAKMLEKLKVAAGPFIVGAELTPGKRGRYELHLLDTMVWNPETGDVVPSKDMIVPETPWLAFMMAKVTSKGDHRYETNSSVALLVTHHALSRLTQRCGARTLMDVWHAARAISVAYFMTEPGEFRDNSRLRVALPDEMGTAVCVLRSCDNGQGDVVVATLWQEGEAPDVDLNGLPGLATVAAVAGPCP